MVHIWLGEREPRREPFSDPAALGTLERAEQLAAGAEQKVPADMYIYIFISI